MAGFFVFLPVFLACQSLFQTVWYYAGGRLGNASDAWSLLFAALFTAIIWKKTADKNATATPPTKLRPSLKFRVARYALLVTSLCTFCFVVYSAYAFGTTESIRTPWPLMPHGTLAAVAILFICTLGAAWKSRSAGLTGWLSALTILAVTLIAPLLYKLGFGFDGFLHRASENLILHTGTLSPKPPYYIGQYVFITWISHLFFIPLKWVDILLVPLAAGTLPFFFWLAFPRTIRPWHLAGLSLFLPLGLFIATTPQAFAYVLGLIAICITLFINNPSDRYEPDASDQRVVPEPRALQTRSGANICGVAQATGPVGYLPALLIALWSVAVHPLAGLPFLGITLLILVINKSNLIKIPILVFTIISVPLAFWINSLRSAASVIWDFSPLLHLSTYANFFAALLPPPNHLTLWADWAALVQYFFPLVLLCFTFNAIASNVKQRRLWLWMTLAAGGLALAGLLLGATGQFSFLIDYERSNYSDRLFLMAQLLLLFPALDGFKEFIRRLNHQAKFSIAILVIIFCAWQTAQAYLTLPRHDATIVGHGWSVGQADQQAVLWIAQDAQNKLYTVLANQSVSAAAIEAFGFKRYAADVFYYPIPTGGPLYQVYLQAAQNPSRDLIKQASVLGQSDLVYFVLNNYWWDADIISGKLDQIADSSTAIDNKVKIYKFDFTSSTKR